jgi:hypothetical protein
MSDKVVITKVGAEQPSAVASSMTSGSRRTQRTYPKGILKIKPVADPAKSPPMVKGSRRHTVRLMTERGIYKHQKSVKRTVKRMSDGEVQRRVLQANLLKGKKTPIGMMRRMLKDAILAGFVSV